MTNDKLISDPVVTLYERKFYNKRWNVVPSHSLLDWNLSLNVLLSFRCELVVRIVTHVRETPSNFVIYFTFKMPAWIWLSPFFYAIICWLSYWNQLVSKNTALVESSFGFCWSSNSRDLQWSSSAFGNLMLWVTLDFY